MLFDTMCHCVPISKYPLKHLAPKRVDVFTLGQSHCWSLHPSPDAPLAPHQPLSRSLPHPLALWLPPDTPLLP